jgi:predicted DNA-binding transcriptional regulator AlpA
MIKKMVLCYEIRGGLHGMAILKGTPEIAKYMGISTRTVFYWMKKGVDFPVKMIHGTYYTSTWLVDQWLMQGKCLYKIRPNPDDLLDVIALAGMKDNFEIDPDHGGYRLKEGKTITIDQLIKAINSKIHLTPSIEKTKDDKSEDIWEIFPDEEEKKRLAAEKESTLVELPAPGASVQLTKEIREPIDDVASRPIPKEWWEG